MFLETICIQQGEVQNKPRHEERMYRTASHFGFKSPALPDLLPLLPKKLRDTKVKCRIIYRETIQELTFEPYLPRKITSLKLIEASPDYAFKLADRHTLNDLLEKKGDCDEILITRNGFITDTSYSNVVLRRGDTYFTPEIPLLNGTKRQKLLQEGRITEKQIHRDSLQTYDRVYLINAMLNMEDDISLPAHNIV